MSSSREVLSGSCQVLVTEGNLKSQAVMWLVGSASVRVNMVNAIGYLCNIGQCFTTLWADQIPRNFFFFRLKAHAKVKVWNAEYKELVAYNLWGNLKKNEELLRKHILFIAHTDRIVREHWLLNGSGNHIYGVCFTKMGDCACYPHVVFFLRFLWFTQKNNDYFQPLCWPATFCSKGVINALNLFNILFFTINIRTQYSL